MAGNKSAPILAVYVCMPPGANLKDAGPIHRPAPARSYIDLAFRSVGVRDTSVSLANGMIVIISYA